MIYLGFAYPQYDCEDPETCLIYRGGSLGAARAAVISAVEAGSIWRDPVAAHVVRRSEGWTRTSDVFMVGSVETIPDEIEVAATPGQLETYLDGEVWRINTRGNVEKSECELADPSSPKAVWGWRDWEPIEP